MKIKIVKGIASEFDSERSLELNMERTRDTKQSNKKNKISDKTREKTMEQPFENDLMKKTRVQPFKYNLIEERLLEAIDLTSQKSQDGRIAAMKQIPELLPKEFLSSFVLEKLSYCIVKGLKKGRSAEQKEAAKLACRICFQVGSTAEIETLYKVFRPLFLTLINSSDTSQDVQEQCCLALGILCFIALEGKDEIEQTMEILKNIYEKENLTDSRQSSSLKCAALRSWCLLFTLLPARGVYESTSTFSTLLDLLESKDLNLRIEAGEAVVLIYENARQFDDNNTLACNLEQEAKTDLESKLYNKLKYLANDSQKCRAKKDRKHQRSIFRDVLKTVEGSVFHNVDIKFGHETLVLNSWSQKKRYAIFCDVLTTGIDLLLVENQILRDIFELGLPLQKDMVVTKLSKRKRNAVYVHSFMKHKRDRKKKQR